MKRNNIWVQTAVLLCIALICGLLLAGAHALIGDPEDGPEQGTPSYYETVYMDGLTYEKVDPFTETTNDDGKGAYGSTATAKEAVKASDGAVLVRIEAKSTADTHVSLVVYVVVKGGSAQSIYIVSTASSWVSQYSHLISNKRITNISGISSVSGATQTQNAFLNAISLAISVAGTV